MPTPFERLLEMYLEGPVQDLPTQDYAEIITGRRGYTAIPKNQPQDLEGEARQAMNPFAGLEALRSLGMDKLKESMRQAYGLPDYVPQWVPHDDTPTVQQEMRDEAEGKPKARVFKFMEQDMENRLKREWGTPDWTPKPQEVSFSANRRGGSPAERIRGIESGSPQGNYAAVGPATKDGDRAYGAYGVMGKNIGPWTAQYYGKTLTPDQFLADPKAQDAVFKGKFEGEYLPKYGPAGAAKAWFAGPGGMNDPKRKDVLGTSVADYEAKYTGRGGKPPEGDVLAAGSGDRTQMAKATGPKPGTLSGFLQRIGLEDQGRAVKAFRDFASQDTGDLTDTLKGLRTERLRDLLSFIGA